LGTALRNQNSIQEEIKSRLKSGNAGYHSVQNFLSTSFLPKNLKITIYRTIIFPVVVYGCETWSLTLREGRRLREFENKVLRRILGPMRDDVIGEWRKIHYEELNDMYSSPNIVRERVHLEDPGVDGNIILRRIFRKWDVEVGTGSIGLSIGTGGGRL
jgi:hypothetical protein